MRLRNSRQKLRKPWKKECKRDSRQSASGRVASRAVAVADVSPFLGGCCGSRVVELFFRGWMPFPPKKSKVQSSNLEL